MQPGGLISFALGRCCVNVFLSSAFQVTCKIVLLIFAEDPVLRSYTSRSLQPINRPAQQVALGISHLGFQLQAGWSPRKCQPVSHREKP